jgi:hypothetical protein
VKLIQDNFVFDHKIGTVKTLECTGAQANQTLVFKDTGVDYRVRYHVNLLD